MARKSAGNEKWCRQIVCDRSNGLCERCGRQGHSVHHRRKRSQGGPWTPSNCVMLCGDGVQGCHGWVEHHPNAANDEGFHVRSFQDEYEVPVYRWGRWVLLDDDGNIEEVDA